MRVRADSEKPYRLMHDATALLPSYWYVRRSAVLPVTALDLQLNAAIPMHYIGGPTMKLGRSTRYEMNTNSLCVDIRISSWMSILLSQQFCRDTGLIITVESSEFATIYFSDPRMWTVWEI
jgi:hypothetical protein